ncbi:ribulose-phosphate 3-epimerase [Clostridium butyricum]|uniref:ribulose-phosphate 3-epimerase n=1 Tax=Clostridium butyricum TaxID=1492 RepID=UPI001CA949A9|nr:ribulose-phosphate 3-epimerase [Clostridium butyricum]MBZ0312904.1 ribulose-phosphate 3-epimerase [Clostridium butyricum]
MITQLSASMMCADFTNLEREVRMLEEAGIDSFHIDIMDGQFVPNFCMGIQDLKCIRKLTEKPVEVHLMIERPMSYLKGFIDAGVDVIYVHPEADYHPSTTLQAIIDAGITPGIAVNPGTSFETVEELLFLAKRVLVMSVNPGNAGQAFLPYIGQKLEKFLLAQESRDIQVYWDGACGIDKIQTYSPKGVKGFVLGTTVLFGKEESYDQILKEVRKKCI